MTTTRAKQSAHVLRQDFPLLSSRQRATISAFNDASVLPHCNYHDWLSEDKKETYKCYNFALHHQAGRKDDPGTLSFKKPQISRDIFTQFYNDVVNFSLYDGLVGLSFDLQKRADHYPVALFLREKKFGRYDPDYHWYSLKRVNGIERPLWMSKTGSWCVSKASEGNIFTDAYISGYQHFAGYMHVPKDMNLIRAI